MRITKTALAAEIAILLTILVVVEWLSTTLTHTGHFWPLVIGWSVYLAVRVIISARKRRPDHHGKSN
jgi:hypothetical protein